MTPAEYAEDCGWVGHDVWHAHCVQLDDDGIYMFGAHRNRHRSLSLFEYAAGLRHRAYPQDAR